ncbi:hypothetical protein J4E93_008275 [Alternaria ventricosa]|uniref:uncharacterized protein n=1 Tax=Alternaria ventricosa TaxID=1187951 RepID=UPI0020C3FB5B|nr:uncharacterized protein J4E93_008275 [Alternaria ventricosa]KAI4640685.1 hypothetical protein J4E93_008275 [Alternaria ventricosa]
MAQVTPRSILALQLPDPRFSVDFANYGLDPKAYATTKKYMQDLFPGQNKPLPPPKAGSSRHCNVHAKPRRDMAKEPIHTSAASQTLDDKWDAHTIECMIMLDESLVDESDRSSASSKSTAKSYATNVTSASALSSTVPTTKATKDSPESTRSFLQLPQAIVNHILSYVFAEERAVSITPYQSRITPQPRRRHRHGPSTIDIRSFMMHPALMVCKQARELGLDILYRDSLFLIDLSDIGGAHVSAEKDISKYWGCWTSSTPPHMVKSALSRASNIRIQLPVPSAEATVVRSATKRKKDAQEDTSIVIDSLRTVTTLITGQDSTPSQPTERSRSASPAGPKILRRKLSFRSAKRPDSLEFVCRGDSPPPQPREPLSTLEVVLVKANADAEVHSQTLDMVAICSSIPVSGALEYHLELDAMRRLWAKRDNGQWRGSEPDGHKLLHDLRALGHSAAKAEVSQTREQPKQTYDRPTARADVLHRDRTRPAQQPTSGRPSLEGHLQQRGIPKTRPTKNGLVARKIKEMESLSKIKLLKGNKQPPTVEELQQIASDIRRGVY